MYKVFLKTENLFKCNTGDFQAFEQSHLVKHLDTVHKKTMKLLCHKCPYISLDNDTLQHHIKEVHEKMEIIVCDICNYVTSENFELPETAIKCTGIQSKQMKGKNCSLTKYQQEISHMKFMTSYRFLLKNNGMLSSLLVSACKKSKEFWSLVSHDIYIFLKSSKGAFLNLVTMLMHTRCLQ